MVVLQLLGKFNLFCRALEDIGVAFEDIEEWDRDGYTICFGEGGAYNSKTRAYTYLLSSDELDYDYTGYDRESPMSVVNRSDGHLPMRRTVYNIEVADDTHSYFVSELGLCVHNTSG